MRFFGHFSARSERSTESCLAKARATLLFYEFAGYSFGAFLGPGEKTNVAFNQIATVKRRYRQ